MNEQLVYTIRPGGTSLWLGAGLADALGLKWGDRLTMEQFESEHIQAVIRARLIAEKRKKVES